MLKYVKGDLFSVKSGIIAHCVNTKGAFGAGVAGQIAKLYPIARDSYMYRHCHGGGWKLGQIQLIKATDDLIIANIAGQDDFGTHKVQVDYSALTIGLEQVFLYAEEKKVGVAMPKIGCGLAGGEWNVVEDIIVKLLTKYPIEVTVYELPEGPLGKAGVKPAELLQERMGRYGA